MPGLDAPDDRPFPFVYYITIRNRSAHTVTVRARKWVVRQKNGEVIVVEGASVPPEHNCSPCSPPVRPHSADGSS